MTSKTDRDAAVRGKSVLITGASRGIGAATARRFAAAGAKLGLAGRPSAELQAVADETGATLIPCDVADAAQVSSAVQAMVTAHGRLDVLINNAGLIDPIALIAQADPDAWGRQIDVNLKGVFYGLHAALPVMQKQGGGTILTVGSGAAYNALEGWSGYCASKAGAIMLTKAAHLEAGAKVRVLSLSPGTVATDMQRAIKTSGVNAVSQLDWEAHIPAEWPAEALLWMCTSDSDTYRGAEVSLRDEGIRRRLGLIA
ncbi:SDR family oxidoreductase [Pararhodobacter zhoushanensis]|uniref:SDR family oxidoreductase n=1 Tax=Pararhodobacter zhoushanensis TaxID=2479545 RepID=A0ABT3GVK3_9RHOB|nr:SDR family oxidoreductase [Pararhodobacter zhoushanensis]MCW1931524.1 SDR family oxidoreductase [Pararhodobacter zhoushanensis]